MEYTSDIVLSACGVCTNGHGKSVIDYVSNGKEVGVYRVPFITLQGFGFIFFISLALIYLYRFALKGFNC